MVSFGEALAKVFLDLFFALARPTVPDDDFQTKINGVSQRLYAQKVWLRNAKRAFAMLKVCDRAIRHSYCVEVELCV